MQIYCYKMPTNASFFPYFSFHFIYQFCVFSMLLPVFFCFFRLSCHVLLSLSPLLLLLLSYWRRSSIAIAYSIIYPSKCILTSQLNLVASIFRFAYHIQFFGALHKHSIEVDDVFFVYFSLSSNRTMCISVWLRSKPRNVCNYTNRKINKYIHTFVVFLINWFPNECAHRVESTDWNVLYINNQRHLLLTFVHRFCSRRWTTFLTRMKKK